MSMRPVDLQTVVPRVAETARVERIGQQEQDKAAAQAGSQNKEAARKGQEEVPTAQHTDQGRLGRERKGRGGRGGQAGAREETTGGRRPDEPGEEPEGEPTLLPPQEPGGRLDLRM